MKYGMNEAPFNDPSVVNNPAILEIVNSILGNDAELKYCKMLTLVYALTFGIFSAMALYSL